MTAVATMTAITPDELLHMPDAEGYELVDGNLVEREMSIGSCEVEASVLSLLRVEAKRTGEARVFANSLGYQCYPDDPGRVRKPDGSVVRRDRLAGIPNERDYMPIPADLVIEVVSPNDLSYDVVEKVAEYIEAGFPLVWVIHPNVRTVSIYRPGQRAPVIVGVGEEMSAEPALTEFRCPVSAFFE